MQETVETYQAKYKEGQETSSYDGQKNISLVSAEAGTLKPGQLLITGTTEGQAVLPTAAFTADKIEGVLLLEGTRPQALWTGIQTYKVGDVLSVKTKGSVAVKLTQAVTKGQQAYFVHTAGGASAIHTWRADADTDKASAVPAKYAESGASGDLVELIINTDKTA